MIAVDIETFDPSLLTLGDGSMRKDGCIVCVGLYDGTDAVCVRPDDPRLRDWLASGEDKVFHNGMYDLSWLVLGYGFAVNGKLHDTISRAALIDEWMHHYDLDSCCVKWGVKGKNKNDTIEAWALKYGIKNVMKQLHTVYQSPEGKSAVDKYCMQDCKATYDLWHAQEHDIKLHDLQDVVDMESIMTRLLIDMKRNGVRIDKQRRNDVGIMISDQYHDHLYELLNTYHVPETALNRPKQMSECMNALGIHSPIITPGGAQSWNQKALGALFGSHPVIELIASTKVEEKLLSTYIQNTFDKFLVNDDRIYSTYYSCRKDDGGTRTGRLACRHPNMQQIPARDVKTIVPVPGYGSEIRSIIIPEEDHYIGAFDYSQIEYLLLCHFAVGPRSDYVREKAWEGVDFHTLVMEMIGSTNRTLTKTFNYGAIYGMGLNTMRTGTSRKFFVQGAEESGMNFDVYTKQLYDNYFNKMAFIRPTMNKIETEARVSGFCRNLSGRVCHPPPAAYNANKGYSEVAYYVMTNYKIQGSASDILKKGLIDAYQAGIFDTLILHATVHDENLFSIPKTKAGAEACRELVIAMEGAYKEVLTVPMRVDTEIGNNWGECTKDTYKEFINAA